jgi:hypothetical protein
MFLALLLTIPLPFDGCNCSSSSGRSLVCDGQLVFHRGESRLRAHKNQSDQHHGQSPRLKTELGVQAGAQP